MEKNFRLVDSKTKKVRRDSDPDEIRICLESDIRRRGNLPDHEIATKVLAGMEAIKAASPEPCALPGNELTLVQYS